MWEAVRFMLVSRRRPSHILLVGLKCRDTTSAGETDLLVTVALEKFPELKLREFKTWNVYWKARDLGSGLFLDQFFLMYWFKTPVATWLRLWHKCRSNKDLWLKQRKSTDETVSAQTTPGLNNAKRCRSANPARCSAFRLLSFNQFLNDKNSTLGLSSNARISDANCNKLQVFLVSCTCQQLQLILEQLNTVWWVPGTTVASWTVSGTVILAR